MKNSVLMAGAAVLLAGCTGSTSAITMRNGEPGRKMDISISSDKNDYLSEDYIAKKAGIFTFIAMKTSTGSNKLFVEVDRWDIHGRRASAYPFTLNGIQPISCTDMSKRRHATKECVFDKKSVYDSYQRKGKLVYDESANGKKSAAVECLKAHPKPSSFGIGWLRSMDSCISDKYEIPRSITPVENRLKYNQLMFTNKHYLLDVGKKGKFKQFLYGAK